MPFAGLHQLLHPVLELSDGLPAPQAHALRRALVVEEGGPAPAPLLLGAAVLGLLAGAAPVLVVVDDAQWLDAPSAAALGFAGRRLRAEGVALVAAVGEDAPPTGLPERTLAPLGAEAADAVLGDLPPGVRAAMIDAAAGNPLALVELPAALSREQLAGREALAPPLPVPARLDGVYSARLAALPAAARGPLLIAAAEGSGDAALVLQAVAVSGDGAALGLQPARDAGVHAGHAVAALEASGLVTLAATASPGGIRSRSRRCSARPRPRSCARRTRRSRPWPGRTGRRGTGPPRRSGPIRPPPTPWRPRASARERAGHATAAAALARAAELTPDADVRAARRVAAPALASVVDAGGTVDDAQLVVWAGAAAFFVGDEDAAVALHERAAARVRAAGDAAVLPFALTFLAGAHLWSGRPAVAQADAEEAGRLAREAGQDNLALQADAVLAGVAALRGREDECRALAERARATARERGLVLVEGTATIALADLELALGLPDAAFDRLDRLAHGPGAHQAHRFGVVPTLVEAAARAGRPTDARPAAAGFAEWARATGSGWALPLAARSLALVAADDAEADALLTEALALHDRHRRPLDRARTELLIGERLRRARRKAEARAPLRAALETFEAAGAAPWAERAREELRAAGAQQPRPGARRPLDRLTPQELQVARLVARGASNSDAAAALFLSPRTVEYHLHKVFRKLGLHARAELAAALAGSETG